jgi:hypothetical protein
MTTLYELSNEYLAVQNKLIEADFDEQTIADTLEGMAGELEVKAQNVAFFIRNLESTADQIKQAEKQMADRRKALENKAATIKDYLKRNMQATGINKIECPYFAISLKKNPPAVLITDEAAIPAEYLVQVPPPPPSVDKKAIAEALKAGVNVAGAELTQGERVDIK